MPRLEDVGTGCSLSTRTDGLKSISDSTLGAFKGRGGIDDSAVVGRPGEERGEYDAVDAIVDVDATSRMEGLARFRASRLAFNLRARWTSSRICGSANGEEGLSPVHC